MKNQYLKNFHHIFTERVLLLFFHISDRLLFLFYRTPGRQCRLELFNPCLIGEEFKSPIKHNNPLDLYIVEESLKKSMHVKALN